MKNRILMLGLLAGIAAASPLHAAERGEFMTDAGISTKVKASLLTERNLKALGIEVQTRDGVVTLSGTVSSSSEVKQAEDVARHVKGVKDVRNELHFKTAKKG